MLTKQVCMHRRQSDPSRGHLDELDVGAEIILSGRAALNESKVVREQILPIEERQSLVVDLPAGLEQLTRPSSRPIAIAVDIHWLDTDEGGTQNALTDFGRYLEESWRSRPALAL